MWLFHKSKYEFIRLRRKAYVVSGVVLALGITGIGLNLVRTGDWQNYGVDFTGGVLVQVRFNQETDDSELRQALGGVNAPPITRFGQENEFVVRAPIDEGSDLDEVAAGIAAQVAAAYGDDAFEIVRRESVGAKIGEELQGQAAMAILFSFVLTLFYLAIRFEIRFGVAAIIATGARHPHHAGGARALPGRDLASHRGRDPDHPGLLPERHHRGLRPDPREPQ